MNKRKQETIKRIVTKEVRELVKEYGIPRKESVINRLMRVNALENKEKETVERQEFEVSLRRERERANIIPLSRLTKQASMFVGGNNCSHPHEKEQYWDWVESVKKVDKDILFVFEDQNKEIYTLSPDSLWYMGNKSAREDRLLGTKKKEVVRDEYRYGYDSIII